MAVAATELMQTAGRKKVKTILVENSRAVARDLKVNEEIYEMAKERGIEILPADMPSLYKHDANPTEKFLRRVIFAYTELEKDMIVTRLQSALEAKRKRLQRSVRSQKSKVSNGSKGFDGEEPPRTQEGKVKVNGRKTLLNQMLFTPACTAKLKALHQQYASAS